MQRPTSYTRTYTVFPSATLFRARADVDVDGAALGFDGHRIFTFDPHRAVPGALEPQAAVAIAVGVDADRLAGVDSHAGNVERHRRYAFKLRDDAVAERRVLVERGGRAAADEIGRAHG